MFNEISILIIIIALVVIFKFANSIFEEKEEKNNSLQKEKEQREEIENSISKIKLNKTDIPIAKRDADGCSSILVVDHEQRVIESFQTFFKYKNYSVDVYMDGLSCLEHFEIGKYDYAFIDLMLPKIDKLELKEILGIYDPKLTIITRTEYSSGPMFFAEGQPSVPFNMEEIHGLINRIILKKKEDIQREKDKEVRLNQIVSNIESNINSKNPLKILVVDDERSVQESLRMILVVKGYHIDCAEDNKTAIEKLKSNSYDIVFTDNNHPHSINLGFSELTEGITLLRYVKENCQKTEVVIDTAYATELSHRRAIELGALEYLHKPFSMEEIYELVDRAIKRNKLKINSDSCNLFDIQIDRLTTLLTQSELQEKEGHINAAIEKCLEAINIIPHPKIYLMLGRLFKNYNTNLYIENINRGLYFQKDQGLGTEKDIKALEGELAPIGEIYCSKCWQSILFPRDNIEFEISCPKCNNLIKYKLQRNDMATSIEKLLGYHDCGYISQKPIQDKSVQFKVIFPKIVTPHIKEKKILPDYSSAKKNERIKEFENADFEWIRIRNEVKRRDGFKCRSCGSSSIELHVHHIIPRSEGGEDRYENLVTLCKNCHMLQAGFGHRILGEDYTFKKPLQFKIRPIIRKSGEQLNSIYNLLEKGFNDHETLLIFYKKPIDNEMIENSVREIDIYKIDNNYIGCFCHLRSLPRVFKMSRIQGVFHTGKYFDIKPEIFNELNISEFSD